MQFLYLPNFSFMLEDIIEVIGIKVNHLIFLILENYLIEHFTDCDSNIYIILFGNC